MQNIVNKLPGKQPGNYERRNVGDKNSLQVRAISSVLLCMVGCSLVGSVHAQSAKTDPPQSAKTAPDTKATTKTQPTVTPVTEDKDDFRVAVGDSFEVAVLLHPELSKKDVTVGPDGRISYPYLGYVLVSGLSMAEFTAKVEKGLSKEIEDPQVTITLLKRADRTVSILGGAIRSPGKRTLAEDWHVLQLLADAGGLVDRADFVSAKLFRKNQVIRINLSALLIDGDTSQNLKLEAGDTLSVETIDKALTHIQVEGAVQKPGWIPIPTDASLLSILSAVGGTTAEAGLSHASIKRNGAIIPIDLSKMSTNVETAAFTVKPGDLLFIPLNQQMFAVFGAVANAKLYPYPEKESLGLMRAISLAGGVTGGADLKHASVVRGAAGTGHNEAEEKKKQAIRAYASLSGQCIAAGQMLPQWGSVSWQSARPANALGQGCSAALEMGYIQSLVQNKEPNVIPINLEDILRRGDLTSDITIHPGDIVYIPSKEQSGRRGFGLQDALGVGSLMRLFVP